QRIRCCAPGDHTLYLWESGGCARCANLRAVRRARARNSTMCAAQVNFYQKLVSGVQRTGARRIGETENLQKLSQARLLLEALLALLPGARGPLERLPLDIRKRLHTVLVYLLQNAIDFAFHPFLLRHFLVPAARIRV